MPNPENLNAPWKPGDPSPNPYGRPKGSRNLSTILREMLDEEIEVTIDGKKEKRPLQDVIIRRLIKKANDGDMRAITEIFDRTEGKAKQEITQILSRGFINLDPLDDPTNDSPPQNSET